LIIYKKLKYSSWGKKIKMKEAVYSLFVLLAVFSIIAITPSAFADHSKVDINMAVGSSVPGCEEMNMCYMPYNAALDPGGEATWHNIDTAAHTVSSGTAAEGPDGIFDSSLVAPEGMFSYKFEEAGTYDYFCMVHPWMTGIVTVSAEHEETGDGEMGGHEMEGEEGMPHSDEHAASGVEDLSDQFVASVTSGVIHHIGANSDDDTLIVHLFGADDDGELKITLNKDIITPFDDDSYVVIINLETVEFEQMGNTLHIDYAAGTDKIEIIGSHVVPEFGTIAMIILAVAIVSIIAITAKTKISLIPKL
jgi:predicted secreted protein with PEFG-CTERM motif